MIIKHTNPTKRLLEMLRPERKQLVKLTHIDEGENRENPVGTTTASTLFTPTSATRVPASSAYTTITVVTTGNAANAHFVRAQYTLPNSTTPVELGPTPAGLGPGKLFIDRIYVDSSSLKVDVYNDFADVDVVVWYTI